MKKYSVEAFAALEPIVIGSPFCQNNSPSINDESVVPAKKETQLSINESKKGEGFFVNKSFLYISASVMKAASSNTMIYTGLGIFVNDASNIPENTTTGFVRRFEKSITVRSKPLRTPTISAVTSSRTKVRMRHTINVRMICLTTIRFLNYLPSKLFPV